jgi:hypothetical protein
LFLEVQNVLVIYPVKFEIEVLPAENESERPPEATDERSVESHGIVAEEN